MLNIVATLIHDKRTGAAKVVAKGGRKQLTQPYDYGMSTADNLGSVAGALSRKVLPQNKWEQAGKAATFRYLTPAKVRFTMPD